MSNAPSAADPERLPWLEPYREVIAAKKRARARSHGPLVAVATTLAVLTAAGGGYWFGQREATNPPPPPRERVAATVERSATQTASAQVPAPAPAAEPPAAEPQSPRAEPQSARTKPPPSSKPAVKTARQRRTEVRHADTRRGQYDRVVAKQREAVRSWPKMPSPGPAGQVIQLGAFSTRERALSAYRERVARYPTLAGMPQVIVPIITQPRGEVLYVLRLGTATREQSQVVCRNLRQSGDHCLVIG